MIPKIIHYCWFGSSSIPNEMNQYINTWKNILHNYTYMLWNEKNFDLEQAPIFVKEAYEHKKYAFVADYVRLYALYKYGGIYLDTDVKLLKDFAPFLNNGFFSSIEYHHDIVNTLKIKKNSLNKDFTRKNNITHVKGIGIQSAIFGGEKGHPYIKDCLDFYNTIHFIQKDGKFYDEIILPDILALCAEKYGFQYIEGTQQLNNNITIYQQDFFTGYRNQTKNSIAIHCAHNSWREKTIQQKIYSTFSNIQWLRKLKNNPYLFPFFYFIRKHIWFK